MSKRYRMFAPVLRTLAVCGLALSSGSAFRLLSDRGLLSVTEATIAWKISWILLAFVALANTYRRGPFWCARELGLGGSARTGATIGLVCFLPLGLAWTLGAVVTPSMGAAGLLLRGVVTPLGEEILFRGYLLRQLRRRFEWSTLAAISVSSTFFGVAHATSIGPGSAAAQLLELGTLAMAGAWLGIVFLDLGDNLWGPIALHAVINLGTQLLSEAVMPEGGLGRILALSAAVSLAALYHRRHRARHR